MEAEGKHSSSSRTETTTTDVRVLLSGVDGHIGIWSTTSGRWTAEAAGAHVDGVSALALCRSGGELWSVSGSSDGTVKVWRGRSLAMFCVLEVDAGVVGLAMGASDDQAMPFAIVALSDGTIRRVDIKADGKATWTWTFQSLDQESSTRQQQPLISLSKCGQYVAAVATNAPAIPGSRRNLVITARSSGAPYIQLLDSRKGCVLASVSVGFAANVR